MKSGKVTRRVYGTCVVGVRRRVENRGGTGRIKKYVERIISWEEGVRMVESRRDWRAICRDRPREHGFGDKILASTESW